MVIPAGFCQVNLVYDGTSLPTGAQTTMGLRLDDETLLPLQVATLVDTALGDGDFMSASENGVNIAQILVKFGPNATGPSAQIATAHAGSAGSDGQNPNTSYLIHKLTLNGGHAGQGRWYQPGVYDPAIDENGSVHTGTITTLSEAYASFHASLLGAELIPVVLHGADSPIDEPSEIQGWVPDPVVATQRRRLRR